VDLRGIRCGVVPGEERHGRDTVTALPDDNEYQKEFDVEYLYRSVRE
jgi:hypothetical protein